METIMSVFTCPYLGAELMKNMCPANSAEVGAYKYRTSDR